MREPIRDRSRLEHILQGIAQVEEYTKGMTKDQLSSNPLHLHATTYNIQIIGEAVYKLTDEFKNSHSETQWRVIEKMRHVLVHDYFAIDADILWNVIVDDLPLLKKQVMQYLEED